MTDPSSASIKRLQSLIGAEFGVGEWLEVSAERVDRFATALGITAGEEIPPFLLLSLLPRLLASVTLPIPAPTTTINYGLERVEAITPLPIGTRVRGRAVLGGVDQVGDALAVQRLITIEDETARVVLTAHTLTRLLF